MKTITLCLAAAWLITTSTLPAAPQAGLPKSADRLLRFSTSSGRYYLGAPHAADQWSSTGSEGIYKNPYTSGLVLRQPGNAWLYLTDDGTTHSMAPPVEDDVPARLVFEFDHEERIYALAQNQVRITMDHGLNWAPLALPEDASCADCSIQFDVVNDGETKLLLGTANGFWIGHLDGGSITWSQRSFVGGPITSIAVGLDQTVVLLGTASGKVFTTTDIDALETWRESQPRVAPVAFVAAHPIDSSFFVAGYSESRKDGSGSLIYISRDEAATWSSGDGTGVNRLPDAKLRSIHFIPNDSDGYLAYLVTDEGVFVSEDFSAWAIEGGIDATGLETVVRLALPQGRIAVVATGPKTMQSAERPLATATCTYQVTPAKVTADAGGGAYQLKVNANSSTCSWTVSTLPSNSPITITSGKSGRGDGPVGFKVQANTTSRSRTLSLHVANNQVTITQAPQPPAACSITVKQNQDGLGSIEGYIAAEARTFNIGVVASASTCAWNFSPKLDALTFNPSSGSGTTTVQVTLTANPSSVSPRTFAVSLGGRQYVLTQAPAGGGPQNPKQPCRIESVSPTAMAYGGGTGSFQVNKTDSCGTITLSSNAAWLTLSTTTAAANTKVTFTVAANTAGERSASITAVASGSSISGAPISIRQDKAPAPPPPPPTCTAMSASASSTSVPVAGGAVTVTIKSQGTCPAATVQVNQAWATVVKDSATSFRIVVGANSGAARTATISVAAPSVTVTGASIALQQDGPTVPPCAFSLSATQIALDTKTLTANLLLTANRNDCSWSSTAVHTAADPGWLKFSPTSGTGTKTIQVTVNPPALQGRMADFSIANIPVTVIQSASQGPVFNGCHCTGDGCGANIQLGLSMNPFPSGGGTATITVNAPNFCSWDLNSNASWITFPSGARGIGNGTITVKVLSNTALGSRQGIVDCPQASLANNLKAAKVVVNQNGK